MVPNFYPINCTSSSLLYPCVRFNNGHKTNTRSYEQSPNKETNK